MQNAKGRQSVMVQSRTSYAGTINLSLKARSTDLVDEFN